MMKVRLRDVAQSAGVSEATVSRVLNRRPGVADDTRQHVAEIAAELGYELPGNAATRTALIGLMTPELTNPVFPLFAQEIVTALAELGHTAVLCTSASQEDEERYISMLRERVRGFVFVSGLHADTTADHSTYFELANEGKALVLLNGYVEGLDATSISSDEAAAAEIAVRHLAELGHDKIGCVTGTRRLRPSARRVAGFLRGQRQAFGEGDESLMVETHYTLEGAREATAELIERGVTAIVAGSDMMALGAVEAVREAGAEVPGDFSVIGYDDTPLVRFTDPPLTTLRQPIAEMGQEAARAVAQRLRGIPGTVGERLFVPALVVRNSTAPAPDATGSLQETTPTTG